MSTPSSIINQPEKIKKKVSFVDVPLSPGASRKEPGTRNEVSKVLIQSEELPEKDTKRSTVVVKASHLAKLNMKPTEPKIPLNETVVKPLSAPVTALTTPRPPFVPLSPTEIKDQRQRSSLIDKELKEEAARVRLEEGNTYKVVLLGTGDSGKSTILRQLILIHGTGFNDKEKNDYRRAIWRVIRVNFNLLCKAIVISEMVDKLGITGLQSSISELDDDGDLGRPMGNDEGQLISSLWKNNAVRFRFSEWSRDYQIDDTAP
jgi:G-protein alpha subunit